MRMYFSTIFTLALSLASLIRAQTPKQNQLAQYRVDTNGQTETTDVGVKDNTTYSLRAGPRGFVLLEDTTGRKKIQHFGKERQPERVVHAAGHGAYGTFVAAGDFSNLTSACWLQQGVTSDVFVRFSVVVAGMGGSEVARDTHGFATKIYSQCGNDDLVGNHLPSFFVNDGILFPDLIHAVKAEPDKGFPTGGTAHTNAYDFFAQRPEGALQLMYVLSDLGIPRDVRHIGGAGVHTYRFLNAAGESTLFKWFWKPHLGYRSLVYDEATKIVGKNGNFQRVDLYNSIAAGLFPSWDLLVQTFPDDGTYMYKNYDLLDATIVVPFEVNPPITLGTMTLTHNPTNFFSEPENIQFSPANQVKGITFVPDPLLQWRLMSYDDTAPHRHDSANYFDLPVNKPVVPVDNNFRDGTMQPYLFEGPSDSSPDGIGGVVGASAAETYPYGGELVNGRIGRYGIFNDYFTQAAIFYNTLDPYAQQHAVDAYRFELGNVADPAVQAEYVSKILVPINSCLARRVAYGIGLPLPPTSPNNVTLPKYPSQYPLSSTSPLPVTGLSIGIITDDAGPSAAVLTAMTAVFTPVDLLTSIIAPHKGALTAGANASQSYITTSSVFYDAIIIYLSAPLSANSTTQPMYAQEFVREAYGHGKPIGAVGPGARTLVRQLGFEGKPGVFYDAVGQAGTLAKEVVEALMMPGRYPERAPLDDVAAICGR